MKPPKVEVTRGTPAKTKFIPALDYSEGRIVRRLRAEFSLETEHATIEGTYVTVQDLRDALRELLRLLESQ